MEDWIRELKDLEQPPTGRDSDKKEERYPCPRCGGTGQYRGVRIHQTESKCFTCGGRGYFKTSPQQRVKAKQARTNRKAEKRAQNFDKFLNEHKELAEYLQEAAKWSRFACDMIEAVRKFGHLTEGQERACYNMLDKHIKKQEQKAKEAENRPVFDLIKIRELIDNASGNGIKRPKLRVGNLQIYPAPMNGKNGGFLYVKENGEYAGKIDKDGKLFRAMNASETVESELEKVAKDPRGALSEHGRITGQCSCCGRELTNPESIKLGIGPICAANFGI